MKFNPEFFYVLGSINIGDGCLFTGDRWNHNFIHLVSVDIELRDYWAECCQTVWSKTPRCWVDFPDYPNAKPQYKACLSGRATVYEFLELAPLSFYKDRTAEIVPCVFDAPRECQASYLQAFFDGQGSVARTRVVGYKKRREVLEGAAQLLKHFGIKASICKGKVQISQCDIPSFRDNINFQCARKREALAKISIEDHFRGHQWDESLLHSISAFYQQGLGSKRIGQHLGLGDGAVRKAIRRLKEKMNPSLIAEAMAHKEEEKTKIAKRAGLAIFQKRGVEFMREIGRKGLEKRYGKNLELRQYSEFAPRNR